MHRANTRYNRLLRQNAFAETLFLSLSFPSLLCVAVLRWHPVCIYVNEQPRFCRIERSQDEAASPPTCTLFFCHFLLLYITTEKPWWYAFHQVASLHHAHLLDFPKSFLNKATHSLNFYLPLFDPSRDDRMSRPIHRHVSMSSSPSAVNYLLK